MRTFLSVCSIFLFLLFSLAARAQTTGWALVRDNNFTQAHTAFEAELRQNPHSESALTGLIFLAETVQDYEHYEQYTNQLLTNDWSTPYVWLFGPMYKGTPETALRQTKLPESVLLPFAFQQADTLFRYRHFAESANLFHTLVPDWNWSVTGPFDNVAGSGYIESTVVEDSKFNLAARFTNAHDVDFGWLRRTVRAPGEPVGFGSLPRGRGLNTYYANTFITVPTARQVALRIKRGEPMKIWLDDQLLAALPRLTASHEWDGSTVTFDLPAGTHRLLVKLSEFPEDENESRLGLTFNDYGNDGNEASDNAYGRQSRTGWSGRANGSNFVLRLTDPTTGHLYTDIKTDYEGTYVSAANAWKTTLAAQPYLDFFAKSAADAPNDLWKQYLLSKAYLKYEALDAGEEYLAGAHAKAPQSAFWQFLLAKFYDANNKSERAEALLSEMDTTNAPTLAEHYGRFLKINKEQDETDYLNAMEHMLRISPTNWTILDKYLEFLKEKGRKDQTKTYVRNFLTQHNTPEWKSRLEDYLKDESYKPETYKPISDKERDKNFKKLQKQQKKTFSFYDSGRMVDYYKQRERVGDVVKTYDAMLEIAPYATGVQELKARYLFEKERLDEATTLLNQLLEVEPYDSDVCELLGDINIEKKNETEALRWYRQAERLNGGPEEYGSLGEKIEKLDNKKKYSGYFPVVNLREIAKDHSWESKYPDEEAVISLFSQQITYLRDEKRVTAINKAVIHIRNDAGAKRWTEADLRQIGQITSAKVLKKDGTITSPDLGYGVAVFKNLQAGDVILLEGSSEQSLPDEIPGEFIDMNVVSWQSPIARATLELLIPKDQELYFNCNRVDCNHTTRDTGDLKMLRWDWRNIAKIENEEATPENYDSYAWMMSSSAADWSNVRKWYGRKTYCRTEPNYEVLATARQLIRPGMTQEQIVETLHTFITKDINYSFVPFLNTNYVPKKPGATLSGKVGDCKDVATLMITLLREQGIPAWYTLVSTHSFSTREPRPTLYIFNHAIVAYQLKDGVLRFADLTTDYFPTGVLPEGDSDAWGLVIRDGENTLRHLPNDAQNVEVTRVEIAAKASMDAAGNLNMDVISMRHGVAAGNWRESMLRATAEDQRKRLSEYFGGGVLNHLNLDKIEFANLDSINQPLRTDFSLTAYNQLDKVSDLYIMPLPLPLSTPTQKALFAGKRANDLDLDALFELAPVLETVNLNLPVGYELAEKPQNKHLDTRFGEYTLTFETIPGAVRIQRNLIFKMRFVPSADFEAFKKFYLDMLDADDALLALRKGEKGK